MKKILLLSFVVLTILAAYLAAGPVTNSLTNAIYENELVSTISTGSFDTLVGTSDSSTLLNKQAFEPNWEYMLVRGAITGSTDSVKVRLRYDALTSSGTFVYSVDIDSFTAAAGEALLLPPNTTVPSLKGTLKAKAYAANGDKVIINRLELWKRRPVTINQNWK